MIHPILAVGNYAAWIYEQSPEGYERFAKRCRFAVFAHAAISNPEHTIRQARGVTKSRFYYGQLSTTMHRRDKQKHLRKYLYRLFSDKNNLHYADMQQLLEHIFDSELYNTTYYSYERAVTDLTHIIASIYASVYRNKIGEELGRFCSRRDSKTASVMRYHSINLRAVLRYERELCVLSSFKTSQEYGYMDSDGLYLRHVLTSSLAELYGLLIDAKEIGDSLREFTVRRHFTFIENCVMIRRLYVLLGGMLYV